MKASRWSRPRDVSCQAEGSTINDSKAAVGFEINKTRKMGVHWLIWIKQARTSKVNMDPELLAGSLVLFDHSRLGAELHTFSSVLD